jgi:hypothetical protein
MRLLHPTCKLLPPVHQTVSICGAAATPQRGWALNKNCTGLAQVVGKVQASVKGFSGFKTGIQQDTRCFRKGFSVANSQSRDWAQRFPSRAICANPVLIALSWPFGRRRTRRRATPAHLQRGHLPARAHCAGMRCLPSSG